MVGTANGLHVKIKLTVGAGPQWNLVVVAYSAVGIGYLLPCGIVGVEIGLQIVQVVVVV